MRKASSYLGGSVAIFGSTKRTTSARLNQACATSKAMMCPEFSMPVLDDKVPMNPVSVRKSMPIEWRTPSFLIKAKNPIAATIDGVTNGKVNAARIVPMNLH